MIQRVIILGLAALTLSACADKPGKYGNWLNYSPYVTDTSTHSQPCGLFKRTQGLC